MTLRLDHVIVAVDDLDAAVRDYRDLGFTVTVGGVHANRATRNALITFADGTYIELLARTNEQPIPGLVDFSRVLDSGEGLRGYALFTDDLDGEITRLRGDGFDVTDAIPGERRRPDGTLVQWRLALIENGFAPFLIQDVTPRDRRVTTDPALIMHSNAAVGISSVDVIVRSIDAAWDRYNRLFGYVTDGHQLSPYRYFEGVTLMQVNRFTRKSVILPYNDLEMFGGQVQVSEAEIAAADPALEPDFFHTSLERFQKAQAKTANEAEQARTEAEALGERTEALFAFHLARETAADDRFVLAKTHQTHIRQQIGVPPTRGQDALKGLDQVAWDKVAPDFEFASAIPDALRFLNSEDAAVRESAYDGLDFSMIHYGRHNSAVVEILPFLAQLLKSPAVRDKLTPLSLLRGIAFQAAFDESLRERAKLVLRDAFPMCVAMLNDPDAEVRRGSAFQLSIFTDALDTLDPILREHIESDPDRDVRVTCLETLEKLWLTVPHSDPSVQNHRLYMAAQMRDSTQSILVRFRAACVLLERDFAQWLEEALTLFHTMMRDNHAELGRSYRWWVVDVFKRVVVALVDAAPQRALNWVLEQAAHPNPAVRREVAYTLRRYFANRNPEVLPVLRQFLRDSSPDVRFSAVSCLDGHSLDNEVKAELQEIANGDPSLTIRVFATKALTTPPFRD